MRYFFALLAFATQAAYGQCCPYLSAVQVLPTNPTTADDVRLVFQASTGNRGNKIISSFTRTGSSFAFLGCYYSGFLTQPQSYSDTVRIGQLSVGSYNVAFTGVISSSSQQCIELQRNASSMTFQVRGTLATRPSPAGWAIYPVPTTSRSLALVVPADETMSSLQLLDVAGRESFTCLVTKLSRQSEHWLLELPDLAEGIYTLRIGLVNGRQITQRVILQ